MRIITTIAIALTAVAAHGGTADRGGVPAPRAAYESGAGDSGARAWERVYREDPADSLYRAAREALNRGEYKRAAAMFRDVERRYPQSQYLADAMYYQAFALSRTGNERDLRTALDVLKEQQRRFPDAPSGTDAGTLAVRIQGVLAHRGDPEAMRQLLNAAGAEGGSGAGGGAGSGGGSAAGGTGTGAGRGGRSGSSACPSEDDDDDIRMAALNALLQMDSERAIPILKQVLARRDECSVALRRKAVFLVAQKQSDESATILLDAARNDPDVEVRRQAVFWLSEVHSDRALSALDSILNSSKDEEVQEKALFALSNTNTARGTEILRAYAQSNAPEELRAKAVFWLGQSSRRSSDNTAFLQSLFDKTSSEEIQNAVIQAMSQAPGEEGARWMLGVVQNTKQPVETRKKALFWAGQRRGIDINTLLALYPKLDDQELKEHFIFVLSERREAAATDKLIEIAKSDKDVEMRKKALFWLAQKNDPRAKQLLMEIINQ
ncbi:MAG TPA: HEAT repeat domain-containing protein [Gemmatimonadaceae bacterium]|nr:HEAT repeat domain-containing protein [Gemmatimonadaceae bacterium]